MQKKCLRCGFRLLRALLLLAFALTGGLAVAGETPRKAEPDTTAVTAKNKAGQGSSTPDAVEALRAKISEQQAQIDKLTRAVELLTERLNATPAKAAHTAGLPRDTSVGQVSSLVPVIPAAASAPEPGLTVVSAPSPVPASAAQVEAYQQKVDALDKTVDTLNKGIAGFKFSGDLRFRYDGLFRASNSTAGAVQNSRERYRVRLNVDKAVAPQFAFHVQLGTGTANNPATYDSDFTGSNTRGYLWLTEYWGDYHRNSHFSVRAGRMSEAFADDAKFLWDDDVRLNGIQEIAKAKIGDKSSIEFRAGQYVFTNPNIQVLPSAAACAGATPPANCVYEKAGYAPGGKVRDSNLFHQGVILHADGSKWKNAFTVDYQHFRNPNQFLIASAAANTPVLVNGFTGITLAGGVGQLGNGVRGSASGLTYTADSYHVGHLGYRVDYGGWKTANEDWPVYLDVQVARNFGGDFLNNAEMATVSIGSVKKPGNVRFLYGYFIKEANSMISQLTDDDIGTGVSVNTRTHYIRVDLGLTKWLQWQNLLYIQNEISGNDPARNFFVASPVRGAATQYRLHSQFAISF